VCSYLLLPSFTSIQDQTPVNQLQKRLNDVIYFLFPVKRNNGHDDEEDDNDDDDDDINNNNNNNSSTILTEQL
jgi:hypothetical protein